MAEEFEARRPSRKELRAEKKLQKQTKKLEKKALKQEAENARIEEFRWEHSYDVAGSEEERLRLDELLRQVHENRAKYATYRMDMKQHYDPDAKRADLDNLNREYYRNMFDYCISPLQHGVSARSVLSAVGCYAGMALFCPDFKRVASAEIKLQLSPLVEKWSTAKARVQDLLPSMSNSMGSFLERTTGHRPSFMGKAGYEFKQDTVGMQMAEYRSRCLEQANRGRIPYTGETAALNYIAFTHEYYEQMRSPDCSDSKDVLRCDYEANIELLKGLAAADGVSEDCLADNVRVLAGQLETTHPQIGLIFSELGYGEIVRSEGKSVERPDGKKFRVWNGEFANRSGEAFTGLLSPREPIDRSSHQDIIQAYYEDLFNMCETADQVLTISQTETFQAVEARFAAMVDDDIAYLDSIEVENETPVMRELRLCDKRTGADVVAEAAKKCGLEWREAHPEEGQRLSELIESAYAENNIRRSAWLDNYDFGDDGEDYEYDEDYDEDYDEEYEED